MSNSFPSSWLRVNILCLSLITHHLSLAQAESPVAVQSVTAVGFTVSDMDRSVSFYRDVLTFKPVSDVEVDGPEYDQLWVSSACGHASSGCNSASSSWN